MLKNLTIFLILSLLSACGSPAKVEPVRFDGKWSYCDHEFLDEPKACLNLEDVQKLRELLIRCQSGQAR